MQKPQFQRLIRDLERAQAAYEKGDIEACRAFLNMVASIAFADASESAPKAPMPETQRRRPLDPYREHLRKYGLKERPH